MSYWDSENKTIVRIPTKDWPNNSSWECVDCGCCGGIQWGGDYPRECGTCKGSGFYARHKESRVIAQYPGGPFLGSDPVSEKFRREENQNDSRV